jgi:hypothetical protein
MSWPNDPNDDFPLVMITIVCVLAVSLLVLLIRDEEMEAQPKEHVEYHFNLHDGTECVRLSWPTTTYVGTVCNWRKL